MGNGGLFVAARGGGWRDSGIRGGGLAWSGRTEKGSMQAGLRTVVRDGRVMLRA